MILTVEPGNPNIPAHVYGSIQNPRKWYLLTTENCNQIIFTNFVDEVLTDIEQHPVPGGFDTERYLMWDNLSVHGTGLVRQTVEMRPSRPQYRFEIVPRPPYRPKYAPVEYMFCEISARLTHMVRLDWTLLNLRMAIVTCIADIGRDCKLNRTFHHCLANQPH